VGRLGQTFGFNLDQKVASVRRLPLEDSFSAAARSAAIMPSWRVQEVKKGLGPNSPTNVNRPT